MIFDENIILNTFKDLPFDVNGIGIFYDKTLMIKKGIDLIPIGINDTDNGGYVRYNGNINLSNANISACDDSYNADVNLSLIVGVVGYTLDSLIRNVMYKLSSIKGITVNNIILDKPEILKAENITNNELNFFKINFNYKFIYHKECEINGIDCIC